MANTRLQSLLMSVSILVTQTTKGAFGFITEAPLNRVVYEGATNTMITCESDNPLVDWTLYQWTNTGSSDTNYLTTNAHLNSSFDKFFAIDHPPGTQVYTLVVFNATISPPEGSTLSTAGVYECYNADTNSYAAAILVVIQTDPVCSSNFTRSTEMLQSGDVIQLSCTIVYGSWRIYPIDAVMTWSVNGQPTPAKNVTFTIKSSPTELTASSTLLINDNYDAIYKCGTKFSQPQGAIYGLATNAPDYFKTCTISPSGFPTASRPTAATTPYPSTTTTTTTTTSTTTNPAAPAHTTTFGLSPCKGILHLLTELLRARCYTDWIICSSETSILGGILWPDCRSHCRSLKYSGGTCMPSSSVGCPCIHPGNKKCNCS